jgi:branched-chain amino acid transport system ATP-binding protein
MSPLLRAEDLTRRFGGLVAVDHVSLAVDEGEIRGVIGPNGAGKSTLFSLLTGLTRPSSGRIWLEDRDITGQPLHHMAGLGIARTFQNLQLCQGLSVLDNVLLGTHNFTRAGLWGAVFRTRAVVQEEAQARALALESIEAAGLAGLASEPVANLSFGHQKLVEIARALASRPRLLLLDEPVAGLNQGEKIELRELILRIRQQGITILLVEHDMRLVMGLCDWISVLDYGKQIAEGRPAEVQTNEDVIRAYLGIPSEREVQSAAAAS